MDNTFLLHQVALRFGDEFKEHRQDVSAILLTPDQHLWLGSDETSTIERLTFTEPQAFAAHKQFRVADFIDLPAPEEQEIDIEGLAFADHYLWVVGSHSWKRKKPKPDKTDEKNIKRLTKLESEANRYLIGRIPLVDGELLPSCKHPEHPDEQLRAAKLEVTERGNSLMDALVKDPHLGSYIGAAIPGKENGFDIEGLAVHQNKILLGLRGPVLRGWAVILEIELTGSSGLLKLKQMAQGEYKKHFVYLNGLGIRDLRIDGQDLLILAGPTMDLDGPVRIYRLQNGVNLQENMLSKPELVLDLPYGNGDDHAEGITLCTNLIGQPSLLVVYDSPAQARLKGDSDVVADVFKLG